MEGMKMVGCLYSGGRTAREMTLEALDIEKNGARNLLPRGRQ